MESWIPDFEFLIKVGVSGFCATLFGLERQVRGKPIGIRTSVLICVGIAAFIHLGGLNPGGEAGDPNRVLGQVITGIGFLGAGVIMTRDGLLKGVTSAAVVWALSAIGCAAGLGRFGIALTLSAVFLSVLIGVEYLETGAKAFRRGIYSKRGD